MLLQIGRRPGNTDVVDLLYECHGRIRRFLELASRVAADPEADAASVREVAGQVRRYFAEAFPLHLTDEDELVFPLLFGTEEAVDDALARMHAEHLEHAALVAELISLCAAIHADPQAVVASAARLAAVTSMLRAVLEPHLALEEATIFPALRALPAAQRGSLEQAMRERRAAALSTTQSLRR